MSVFHSLPYPQAQDQPLAIVLACEGAAEGPLNVVRALGEHHIPVVLLTESLDSPVVASRYVHKVFHVPGLTDNTQAFVDALFDIAHRQSHKPVLFPTADPDLMMVNRLAARLQSICAVVSPPAGLVAQLSDKRRFADLAREFKLPVPLTYSPNSLDEIRAICDQARYPVIVKPSHPQAWHPQDVHRVVGNAKAIQVDTAQALADLCLQIGKCNFDFLIQEYIPGADEEHYDVHAFLDLASNPVAVFSGQKLRIYPPHAGSGSFVRSVRMESLQQQALGQLQAIGYTGIANMNFKRNPQTGEFWLLEINPRVSQWNILASHCGINLPLLAYQEACAMPLSKMGRQKENIYYLNFNNDLAAFRIYRREGLLGTFAYLRSLLLRPRISQCWNLADMKPFLFSLRSRIRARLAR
jgi:predicted ATP-grasp superfamily ATP-dependent carboligase